MEFEVNHNDEVTLPVYVRVNGQSVNLTVDEEPRTFLLLQKSELKEIFEKVFAEEEND